MLQHGELGPPGRVGEWLRARELPFVIHRVWEAPLPDPTAFEFVISLGSEKSVTNDSPSWIPGEIDLLREAVDADVPVLGLCFGGQALSVALGGGSDQLEQPQIGWLPVKTSDALVPQGPWLHYHFELMRVPPGAREIARSAAGTAAFRFDRHLAIQFHPEVDPPMVERWVEVDPNLPPEITPARIAADSATHAPAARDQAFRMFDGWLDAAATER